MASSDNSSNRRLERERRARLEAERLLEDKSDELYESLMQVQSSERLLRSATASIADGLLFTDRDHRIILANEQLTTIYSELSGNCEKGTDISRIFTKLTSHPDYCAMIDNNQSNLLMELVTERNRTISVSVRLTKDGFIASTHRDITEQKAAEDKHRQLLVDLMRAQRLESIGRMTGMIAHDFNNIIASIKGYAGFLREDLAENDVSQKSVERITTAALKAEKLIQQVLEYGNQKRTPAQDVSLIPVLEDCLELIVPAAATNFLVEFDPPEDPIWVSANETRLEQLFTNLLTNARQATLGKQALISVSIDLNDRLNLADEPNVPIQFSLADANWTTTGVTIFDRKCVRISIVDNGSGITSEAMSKVFEMYFSTNAGSSHRGVGMSSVADVIADFGGGIRLTSQPDSGTLVEVVFPTATSGTPAIDQKSDKGWSNESSYDVLLIDDDENVGEMIQQMLERSGIRTEYFSNARRALDVLRTNHDRWKLVISDQIMPEIKGTEILLNLREKGISIPFIICSGQIDVGSKEMANLLEDAVVGKPVNREILLETVRKYV